MRIALVRDAIVENVVEATADFVPPDGLLCIPTDSAGPGWRWDGNSFHEGVPDSPVPSVSPVQIRRALRRSGLYDAVAGFVAAADSDVKDAWEYATEIDRHNPLINAAAAALGKTDAEIDALFSLAASLPGA